MPGAIGSTRVLLSHPVMINNPEVVPSKVVSSSHGRILSLMIVEIRDSL